jgi:diguanylate cyclase (GGDEF)-like protein/PAS domain S-box-containing protein
MKSNPKTPQPVPQNTALRSSAIKIKGKAGRQPAGKSKPSKRGVIDYQQRPLTLRASEARYRRLFETAKDGILILDGNTGRIVDANPFLQDMLGYAESELIGKALWEIGPVKNIPASQEAMRQLQNNEYIRYEDLPLETKAGVHKQVEFVSNVYLVDGWRVIQCNIRDITERKHAEAEVLATNDKLINLVDELQWRDQEMQLLNHMNEILQSCMTQAEAYEVITLSAEELFPGQNGCLAILHDRGQDLETVACWGPDVIMNSAFALQDCWALRRGQLHEVVDPQAGLNCHHFSAAPQTGYLCLPLSVQGETLGVLSLMDSASLKGMHHLGVKQLAVTIGETIKLSLSNLALRDALREQTIHDTLTNLFNRRYLDETLPRELHMARRRNAPLSVVMLDLDGFKQFNDSFGHGPGDALLREFGHALRGRLRKSDISCRYGGDEFLLILPDSSVESTQERLEQIRIFMRGLQFQYGEQTLDMVTLSAGIAQFPEHGTTPNELLLAADKALYAAKRAGGDRTIIYQMVLPL